MFECKTWVALHTRLTWNTWNAPRKKIACGRTRTMSLGYTIALSLGFTLNWRSDSFLQKSTVDGRIEPEVTTPNEMLRQQSPSSVRKLVPDHNALSGCQRRLTEHSDRQIQICGFSPSSVIHELLEFQESQDSLVWYPGTRNHRIWQNEDVEFFFCDLYCGDCHRLCRIKVKGSASFTMTLLIAFSEIPSAYDAFVAPRASIELLPWLVAKEFHIRLKVEMTPQPTKCCHVIVFFNWLEGQSDQIMQLQIFGWPIRKSERCGDRVMVKMDFISWFMWHQSFSSST